MSTQPREKVTDKNLSRMNRYSEVDGARDAHKLYLTNFAGDLATISRAESPSAGYPMGSVSPFIIDYTGNPVIMTASIAQHTKNALENPKTSLMVREVEKNHQVETGWRLTCMGDLKKVSSDERQRVANAYFRHYPNAKLYEGTHDFDFYRLYVKIARVILGFGKIAWVNAESLVQASPFEEMTEQSIIEHMNNDHAETMEKYLSDHRVVIRPNAKPAQMVGVNQFGVTLRYRKKLHFIPFDKVALNAEQAKEQIIHLAKK